MVRNGPRKLALIVPGLICLGIAVAAGVQLYEGSMSDIYWTPMESASDLDGAAPDVEVWLDGDLLQRHAEQGRLVDDTGAAIAADRLRVRINRRDRVQRAQIAIVSAAAGAGLAFLLSAFLLGTDPRASRGA